MLKIIYLNSCCLLLQLALFAQSSSPFCIGESLSLDSEVLSEKRALNIYLPQQYGQDDSTHYNIIYLLDGSAHEDFVHISGLVQFFELMFPLPPTIIVGIENVDRKRDFTFPTRNEEIKKRFPNVGGSEKFINFLANEVQPFIEAQYPTTKRKILIGQSLGGLLASEILLKHPHLFSDYIIVSPSLWWDKESLSKEATALWKATAAKSLDQVYISVGTEGEVMERTAKELYEVLKNASNTPPNLHFKPLPEENHATILHKSVYEAFKLFFPYVEQE